MTPFQELASDVERRQARIARRQMWFRARRELDRRKLLWTALFLLIFAVFLVGDILAGLEILK